MIASQTLDHPVRRRILRIVLASGGALTPGEIEAAGLPGAGVSVIGYHARVLAGAGLVRSSGNDGGGPAPRFAASTEDPEILALLDATRDADAA